MKKKISVFWFRRDLRLHDNAGLYHALKQGDPVLPLFIFDTTILDRLEDKQDRRVDFIHQALAHLQEQLAGLGSGLKVVHGTPKNVFAQLVKEQEIHAVYTNHDYEPDALRRDEEIKALLAQQGIALKTYKDQCVFEKDEVVKDDGKPYTVFTPYSRKWKAKLNDFYHRAYPVERYSQHFLKHKPA